MLFGQAIQCHQSHIATEDVEPNSGRTFYASNLARVDTLTLENFTSSDHYMQKLADEIFWPYWLANLSPAAYPCFTRERDNSSRYVFHLANASHLSERLLPSADLDKRSSKAQGYRWCDPPMGRPLVYGPSLQIKLDL